MSDEPTGEADGEADGEERPAAARSGSRWPWFVGVAAVLGVVLWLLRGGPVDGDGGDAVTGGSGAQVEPGGSGGVVADGPVARVRGQVWLEVPVEGAPPPVDVVLPTTGGETAAFGPATGTGVDMDTDTDTGTAGGFDDAEWEPPTVELVAPEVGTCRVLAWQSGVQVGGPLVCEDDGSFELALHPGVSGRTAFEVLVTDRLRGVIEVEVPEGGLGRLPAIALGVASVVAGQVVDIRGDPVSGATFEAMPWPNLEEPEPWRTVSDAEGMFRFDTVPPGPLTMRVAAEGFSPSVASAIAPQEDVLVTLGALIDLNGKVVGQPEALARTRVRLEGSAIWPAIETNVDPETGAFTFEAIPDGVYAVEAITPAADNDPDAAELASFPLENVTPELEVTLALGPAVRARVQVVDPRGEPVPEARVTLANASVGLLSRIATTDLEGRAAPGPVVPGPYVLRAEADGFLPAEPLAITLEPPDPDAGDEPPIFTLTLLRPGSIAGIVVDEDGRPVADAVVEYEAEHLHSAGESEARAQMFAAALTQVGSLGVTVGPVPPIPLLGAAEDAGTDSLLTEADGTFVLELLAPGTYRLAAYHGRYAHSESVSVGVSAGTTKGGVRLVLRRGHALTGRVLGGNARPLAGVEVAAGDGSVAFTDDRGVFDLGLRRGAQKLVLRAPGYAPLSSTVNVRGPTDVELTLREANAIVEGRIEGENGEVLVDARVTLRPRDGLSATRVTWTDAKGLYRFENVPPGAAEIEVDHPEHAATSANLTVDETGSGRPAPVDIAMDRGWGLDVLVRRVGSREPIEGARVIAAGRSALTDADGRASLDNLTGADVRVKIEAADLTGWGGRVTRPDAGRAELSVELTDGGSLAGRITDYRGDPVPGAKLVVKDADGAVVATTHSDAEGRWDAPGLPEGDYEVSATPPGARDDELAPDAQSTDIRRGHVTRGVDLRFDRR